MLILFQFGFGWILRSFQGEIDKMLFEEFNIMPEIVKALKEEGIDTPTDIQEKSIPIIKQGKDLIGISKTGSGKTIAFAVPIIEMIRPHDGLQAIILSPTRELAVQISKEFSKFSRHMHMHVATVYGGVGMQPQIDSLKKAEIMVGTPGRVLDHLSRGTLNLSKVRIAVLDEADKMVDMGFIDDVNRIFSQTPRVKQVLLFGATIGDEVEHLKRQHMRDPVTVQAELRLTDEVLKQYYYNVKPHEKFSLLVHLLKKEENMTKTLIFCSSRSTVELVQRNLRRQGFKADMIHGKLSQNKRQFAIDQFNDGKLPLLVASAVAARGLQIGDVSHIINYDLSQDAEEYIHRIGRTARAGESGIAITLLTKKDYDSFNQILSRYKVNVEKIELENFATVPFDAGGMGRNRRGNFRPRRFGESRDTHDRPQMRGGSGFGRPRKPFRKFGDRN